MSNPILNPNGAFVASFPDKNDDTLSSLNRTSVSSTNSNSLTSASPLTSPDDDAMSISSQTPQKSRNNKPGLPPSHTSSSVGSVQKKRRRIPVNCVFCRQRKQKCDRKMPCTNCIRKNNSNCVYGPSGKENENDGNTSNNNNSTNQQPKLGILNEGSQSFYEDDMAQKMGMRAPPFGTENPNLGKMMTMGNFLTDRLNNVGGGGGGGVTQSTEMKKRLDKMESLVLSLLVQKEELENQSNSDSDEGAKSDLEDLGESLGMLKLDKKGKSVYHGDTYWGYMFSEITEIQEVLRRIREEFDNADVFGKQRFESLCQVTDGQQDTSSIPFGGIQFKSSSNDVLKTLPSRELCELLIDRFFDAIEPLIHIVHRPSFEIGFETFWKEPENTELLWVSLLLGMLTLALQSYTPHEVPEPFKGKEVETWTSWLNAMELCGFIGKLTFKPSLLNIRVLLLWMLLEAYQSDWNHKSWTSMGVLVRVAQSMGMHRDPSWFIMSPFESEERRRLWKSLEFLDSFHSIGQGLPLAIRSHENDVHEPININDLDIMPQYGHLPDAIDMSKRTDSSFAIFRGRLNDIRCEAFTKNLKIEGKVDSMNAEEVWEIDRKLHQLYDNLPPFLGRRADESSPEDTVDIIMQRFMLEIDYLKTVVVLHRTFSSNGLRNNKYQRNREETLNASVTILERYQWLYLSAEAEPIRLRFWLVGSALTFTAFIHAVLFVTVSLMNNFDTFSLIERNRYLEAIRRTKSVLDCVGTSISCDFRQAAIAKLLLSQVDEVTKMNAEQRASRLRRQGPGPQNPPPPGLFSDQPLINKSGKSGIMMELDTRDADIHVDILNQSDSSNWSPNKDFSPESMNTFNSVTSTSSSSVINQKISQQHVTPQQAQQQQPQYTQQQQLMPPQQQQQQPLAPLGQISGDILSPSAFGDGSALYSDAFFGDAYRMQQIVGSEEWDYFMQTIEGAQQPPPPPPNV